MAKNIGAIAISHIPTIGFALDTNTTNLHIDAAIRGQSLTDFQKTRNAQVVYSVAGRDEDEKDWDKE